MVDERTEDELSALEIVTAAQDAHDREVESVVGISAHMADVREAEAKYHAQRMEDQNLRAHKWDIPLGAARGVSGAFEEGADLLATLYEEDIRLVGGLDLNPFDAPEGTPWYKTFGYMSPSKIKEGEEAGTLNVRADALRSVESGWGLIVDSMPEVERASGALVEPMAKFITGFIVGKKLLKAGSMLQGVGYGGQFLNITAAGAIADTAVFDGQEARLSNLIESSAAEGGFPDISNALTAFLAADEETPELVGRLQAAVEGAMIGSLFDGFLAAARGIKAVRKIHALKKATKKALEARTPLADNALPEGVVDTAAVSRADDPKAIVKGNAKAIPEEELIHARKTASREEISRVMTISETQRVAFKKAMQEGDEDAASAILKDFNEDNIDWSKIEDAQDIKQVLAATERIFYDLMEDATGGIQSNIQTKMLAEMVDASAKEIGNLFRDVRGSRGIAARFYAAQRSMLASAKEVKRTAQLSLDNPGSAKHEAAALRQLQVHAAIQAEIKGAQTEIARALQGMGMIKDSMADNYKAFDDIRNQFKADGSKSTKAWQDKMEELLDTADLQTLNRMTKRTGWDRFSNIFIEYTINSMLSSPKTHVINFVSNVLNTGLYSLDRILGGGWRYMRHGDKQAWREARIDLYSKITRMGEAAKLAQQAWRDGAPVTDVRQRIEFKTRTAIAMEGTDVTSKLDSPEALAAYTKDAPDFGAKIIARETEVIRNDLGEVVGAVDHNALEQIVNTLGRVVRIPGRGLITGDEFFKAINRNAEISVQAFRQADEEALAKGLDYGTDAYEAFVRDRVKKLGDVGIKDVENLRIQQIARDKARLVTFQETPKTTLGRTGEKAMNSNRFIKLVLAPFFRTPMNILRQGIFDRTALGYTMRTTREVLTKGHARDVAEMQARMYTGMAFMSSFAFGTDADEEDGGFQIIGKVPYGTSAKAANVRDYSIRFFDTWYNFNRLEPFGMWLGLVADIKTTMKYHDDDEELIFSLGQAAMGSFLNNVTDKTFMTSLNEFQEVMESIRTGRESTIKRGLARWSGGQLGKLIPQFFKGSMAAAEGEERYAQEAWSLLDVLAQRSATFNGDLRQSHDILGRPISRDGALSMLLNPFALSENSDDPVDQELFRLGFQISNMQKTLGGAFELTVEEYSKMTGLVATTGIHEILTSLISSPGYKDLTDRHKSVLLKEQIMAARVTARAMLLAEGDIAQRIAIHGVDATKLLYGIE